MQINLTELLRKIIADNRTAFSEKGIELMGKFSEKSICLEADPQRLTQVIANLLHNSLKFTDKGGRVAVCLETDNGTNEAVIEIADTGIGIRPEILEYLFLPFKQVENGKDQSGLGLGLTIVKGLVEQHGGTVDVFSDGVGQGASFTVRLPMC